MEHVPWWQSCVVYQIYPRSFADTTGDGVGDLQGIRSRLPYLQWLGVDVLWLSPVFRSPMADFGYDVSDYCDIDPLFGTLADMDDLIAECHERGMRLMLDWVPNHTSVEHRWFQESRTDRTNPKADWYVWRDQPANNWLCSFSGGAPAWTFDEARSQWYLHCFLSEQPDLNWDNPNVEQAMHDTLRFWLNRGVDGFRMDVVHLIGKQLDRDDPTRAVEKGYSHVPFNDAPVTHERLRRIRGLLDSYPGERASVGEVYLLNEAAMAPYYGQDDELHMSFNFAFVWTKWDAAALRERISSTIAHLGPIGAWPTWVISNHDVPRHRQRYGGTEAAARMATIMLLTLPGTPFMYQGEELGLLDAVVSGEQQRDPGGRDGCRAPIPWTPNACDGRSDHSHHGWPAEPWLPFAPESEFRNVATMRDDEQSILHLYRNMLALRHAHPALQRGEFRLLDSGEHVLAYERSAGDQRLVVVLNLGDQPTTMHDVRHSVVLLGSIEDAARADDTLVVAAHSGVVVQLP